MTAAWHPGAAEVLGRVEALSAPSRGAQLLACLEDRCLLREVSGCREVPVSQLPEWVDLSPLIDHTLLRADGTAPEIDQLCQEAAEHHFASVCVNGMWVSHCKRALEGTPVRICTVVNFPLGASSEAVVLGEVQAAREAGAQEIDLVLPVGRMKGGEETWMRHLLAAVRQLTPHVALKLILETCLLKDTEKQAACQWAMEAGFDFVKTSTGFSTGGATEADVRLMRAVVGSRCGVKASGGIKTYDKALAMVLAGATRLGLSQSLSVVKGRP